MLANSPFKKPNLKSESTKAYFSKCLPIELFHHHSQIYPCVLSRGERREHVWFCSLQRRVVNCPGFCHGFRDEVRLNDLGPNASASSLQSRGGWGVGSTAAIRGSVQNRPFRRPRGRRREAAGAPPSPPGPAPALTSVSLLRFQRSRRPIPSTQAKSAGCTGDHMTSYT